MNLKRTFGSTNNELVQLKPSSVFQTLVHSLHMFANKNEKNKKLKYKRHPHILESIGADVTTMIAQYMTAKELVRFMQVDSFLLQAAISKPAFRYLRGHLFQSYPPHVHFTQFRINYNMNCSSFLTEANNILCEQRAKITKSLIISVDIFNAGESDIQAQCLLFLEWLGYFHWDRLYELRVVVISPSYKLQTFLSNMMHHLLLHMDQIKMLSIYHQVSAMQYENYIDDSRFLPLIMSKKKIQSFSFNGRYIFPIEQIRVWLEQHKELIHTLQLNNIILKGTNYKDARAWLSENSKIITTTNVLFNIQNLKSPYMFMSI